MKNILLILTAILLASCGKIHNNVPATGKPYEIFVVASKDLWKSSVGDTIRAIFKEPVEMLNQDEPIYDLFNIAPEATNSTLLRHRNLLFVSVSNTFKNTTLELTYDKYAEGQIMLNIESPSIDSASAYIWDNRTTLVALLDKTERDRMVKRATQYNNLTLQELIANKFGIEIAIPKGYRVRKDTTNFLWISYELPLASQGITIYTFTPSQADTSATSLYNTILVERNNAVKGIPGPSKESFMTTETIIPPTMKGFKINGQDWIETRGFWKVYGDFMGGPFVNYATYDKATNKIIALDAYVFSPSPKYGKRNYIRQMESLVMTVKLKHQIESQRTNSQDSIR